MCSQKWARPEMLSGSDKDPDKFQNNKHKTLRGGEKKLRRHHGDVHRRSRPQRRILAV